MVGSLFSGIGGFDLGLERAGMEVRWQVERDEWCRNVLAKHWPKVKRYGAIEDVNVETLEPVNLICGGFPCQPHSVANNRSRGGVDDERWLWPQFSRLVGILRPRFVLVENVTGLFTVNRGRAFGEILTDLAQLGYDCEWSVLSAADVGAPHLRKRVWIVADADRTGLEGRELLSQRADQWTTWATGLDDRRFLEDPISGDWEPQSRIRPLAHGISSRVAKLQALGNAVVPQCAEAIGHMIMARADTITTLGRKATKSGAKTS